jgi:hypothetical protein
MSPPISKRCGSSCPSSTLSPQEFMPLSRRAAVPATKAGGGALFADAPVFVSAAEFFGPTSMNLLMGGDGSRDSSNGSDHPLNCQVGELWVSWVLYGSVLLHGLIWRASILVWLFIHAIAGWFGDLVFYHRLCSWGLGSTDHLLLGKAWTGREGL